MNDQIKLIRHLDAEILEFVDEDKIHKKIDNS